MTKPGIIRGNIITAAAGWFLASNGNFDWQLLLAMLVGIALVIASGCVFNNVLDRGIDAQMQRTKKRAMVTGAIPVPIAVIYGALLGIAGAGILLAFTNRLTVMVALLGIIFYVIVYGYAKRNTQASTIIGSISGAVPPVVGYTSVANQLDGAAFILFFILVFWQIPHFYAIGVYRKKEYEAAGLPILTVTKDIKAVQGQMLVYIAAFTSAAASLYIVGYTGLGYLIAVALTGVYWFSKAANGLVATDADKWARKVFKTSLMALLLLCLAIALDSVWTGFDI